MRGGPNNSRSGKESLEPGQITPKSIVGNYQPRTASNNRRERKHLGVNSIKLFEIVTLHIFSEIK